MAEFKIIETQEELDRVIGERINSVKAKYTGYLSPEQVSEKYKDYMSPEQVQEKYKDYVSGDDLKSQLAGKDKEIADRDAQIVGFKTNELKQKVALKNKIPFELALKLSGSTEEEIQADAENMAKFIRNQDPAPLGDPDGSASADAAYLDLIKNLE